MTRKQKPIRSFTITAPEKDTTEAPSTFARFLLIPYFKAMEDYDRNTEIHCNIILNDNTVGKEFFDKMRDAIYWEYPIVLSRYHLVRRINGTLYEELERTDTD